VGAFEIVTGCKQFAAGAFGPRLRCLLGGRAPESDCVERIYRWTGRL